VRLIEGAGGVFDVEVDGRLVFSKHKVGRFPEAGEVLEAARRAVKK
jgi:selT/selW/selH-like putative selenoprotein